MKQVVVRSSASGGDLAISQSPSQESVQGHVGPDLVRQGIPGLNSTLKNDLNLKRARPDQAFQPISRNVKRPNYSMTYTYDSSQAEDSIVLLSGTNSFGSLTADHTGAALQRGTSHPENLCCAESDALSEDSNDSLADDLQSQRLVPPYVKPPSSGHRISTQPLPTKIPSAILSPEVNDMLKVLYASEAQRDVKPDYLATNHGPPLPVASDLTSLLKGPTAQGGGLTPDMRKTVVSWLIEVATEFKFHQDTLYLAISLLDRFLSMTKGLPQTKLQLVGVACAMIAAKHEEEQHPSVGAFIEIVANCFQADDLLRMEGIVLSAVGFRVTAPTSRTFFCIFKQGLQLSPTSLTLASYLMELSLLEYDMLGMLPSHIAAAALALAIARTGSLTQLQPLSEMVPFSLDVLQPCMQRMRGFEHVASSTLDLQAAVTPVKEKYGLCGYQEHRR